MLNQNSIWRYLMILVVLSVATIYALPNIYPEDPSLQITATRGAEVSAEKVGQLEQALQKSNIAVKSVVLEKGQIRYQASMQELAANEEVRRSYLSV